MIAQLTSLERWYDSTLKDHIFKHRRVTQCLQNENLGHLLPRGYKEDFDSLLIAEYVLVLEMMYEAPLNLWHPLVYSGKNGDETEQGNYDLDGIATRVMYTGPIQHIFHAKSPIHITGGRVQR